MAVIILAAIISAFVFREIDTNPATVEIIGDMLSVKNKSGKVLWTKPYHPMNIPEHLRKLYFRVLDINSDGTNEVLVSNEPAGTLTDSSAVTPQACFSNKGKLLWQYIFRDSVRSASEIFEPRYNSHMIDTVTIGRKKLLLMMANHYKWYPSAIYLLDLQTGRRMPGTLWNSGHLQMVIIKKTSGKAGKELIVDGINNAFKKLVLFSVNIDDINGVGPTLENFRFLDKNPASIKNYILLPVTDVTFFCNKQVNNFMPGSIIADPKERQISVNLVEGREEDNQIIGYYFDYDLKPLYAVFGNPFVYIRNTLIREGKLSPPLTNSEEYHRFLMDQIEFWDGKKFVNRNGLIANHD
jgi:hypothetical protein